MTRGYRRAVAWLSWLGLMAVVHGSLLAQGIAVRVRDEGSLHPTVGALVTLELVAAGEAARRTLTDTRGRARLIVAVAGRYRLRIDRIGFQSLTVGPYSLVAGDTTTIDVLAPNLQVTLPDLEVVASATSCEMTSEAGSAVSTLWDEARKVLLGSQVSDSLAPLLRVTKVRRIYDQNGAIFNEARERSETRSHRPFVAADPAQLARSGFRSKADDGGSVFYAPDAAVLLSTEFLEQHCLKPTLAPADSDLVGLAFSPTERFRKRTDVVGTLWLSRATTELRRIEFKYTNIKGILGAGHDGGEVSFVRLPDGGWIVGSWRARVGLYERAGEVSPADPGTVLVTGTVFDSLSGRPLPGVAIRIGPDLVDTTTAAGTYEIPVPAGDSFTVEVSSPVLAATGSATAIVVRSPPAGERVVVDFGAPSLSSLASRVCATRPVRGPNETLIVGQLGDSGRQAPGSVWVGWNNPAMVRAGYRAIVDSRSVTVMVPVDRAGRFVACAVPAGKELTVAPELGAPLARLTLSAGEGAYLELHPD